MILNELSEKQSCQGKKIICNLGQMLEKNFNI